MSGIYNIHGRELDKDRRDAVAYNYFTISTSLPVKLVNISMKFNNVNDISLEYNKIYEGISIYSKYLTNDKVNNKKDYLEICERKLIKSVNSMMEKALKFHNSSHYTIIDSDTIGGSRSPDYFFWCGYLGKIPYVWNRKLNTTSSNLFGLFKLDFAYLYLNLGIFEYNISKRYYNNVESDTKSNSSGYISGVSLRRPIYRLDHLPNDRYSIDVLGKLLNRRNNNLIIDYRSDTNKIPYYNYLLGYIYRYYPKYFTSSRLKVILPKDPTIDGDLVNNTIISPLAYILLLGNKYRFNLQRFIGSLVAKGKDKLKYNNLIISDKSMGEDNIPEIVNIHDHVLDVKTNKINGISYIDSISVICR